MTRAQYRLAIRALLERPRTVAELAAAIGAPGGDPVAYLLERRVPVRRDGDRCRIDARDYAAWIERLSAKSSGRTWVEARRWQDELDDEDLPPG